VAITTYGDIKNGLRPPIYVNLTNNTGASQGSYRFNGSLFTGDTSAGGKVINSGSDLAFLADSIRFPNPVSGNTYLCGFSGATSIGQGSTAVLVDILWHTSVNSSAAALSVGTGSQTINSATWPARDINGSTNGEGVYVGFFITATLGNNNGIATLTYTNSAGTGSRVAPMIAPFNTSVPTTLIMFGLDDGDVGIRSVQSFEFDTDHVSGSIRLIAFKPICVVPLNSTLGGQQQYHNAITLGFPRILDNSALTSMIILPGNGYNTAHTWTMTQG
jgi:hypothetical protein